MKCFIQNQIIFNLWSEKIMTGAQKRHTGSWSSRDQSLPAALLTKTRVLLLAGISITWSFGGYLGCVCNEEFFYPDMFFGAVKPDPDWAPGLPQPLSVLWCRESPTRGHVNVDSDQTRGWKLTEQKDFLDCCFSVSSKFSTCWLLSGARRPSCA